MYEVTTNEGTRLVRATAPALYEAMWAYIGRKKAAGVPLAAIVFSFRRVQVGKV